MAASGWFASSGDRTGVAFGRSEGAFKHTRLLVESGSAGCFGSTLNMPGNRKSSGEMDFVAEKPPQPGQTSNGTRRRDRGQRPFCFFITVRQGLKFYLYCAAPLALVQVLWRACSVRWSGVFNLQRKCPERERFSPSHRRAGLSSGGPRPGLCRSIPPAGR